MEVQCMLIIMLMDKLPIFIMIIGIMMLLYQLLDLKLLKKVKIIFCINL